MLVVELISVVNAKDSGRRMVTLLECVVIHVTLESMIVVRIVVCDGRFC